MFKARIKETGEIGEFITGKNLQGETILQKVGTASFLRPEEVENIDQLGWHPASELPKEKDVEVIMLVDVSSPQFTGAPLIRVPIFGRYINGWPKDVNVKWWCYPPKKE